MDVDLKKFMDTCSEIAKDPYVIKRFLHHRLCGLAYCYSHKILHRDLKPHNLLIESNKGILKLADFGSAREVDVHLKRYTGGEQVASLMYMAPELLNGLVYSIEVDMWSVGCIFAEMGNWEPLFDASNQFDLARKIFSLLDIPDEKTWPQVTPLCRILRITDNNPPKNLAEVVPDLEPAGVDLLSKMLSYNPRENYSL